MQKHQHSTRTMRLSSQRQHRTSRVYAQCHHNTVLEYLCCAGCVLVKYNRSRVTGVAGYSRMWYRASLVPLQCQHRPLALPAQRRHVTSVVLGRSTRIASSTTRRRQPDPKRFATSPPLPKHFQVFVSSAHYHRVGIEMFGARTCATSFRMCSMRCGRSSWMRTGVSGSKSRLMMLSWSPSSSGSSCGTARSRTTTRRLPWRRIGQLSSCFAWSQMLPSLARSKSLRIAAS